MKYNHRGFRKVRAGLLGFLHLICITMLPASWAVANTGQPDVHPGMSSPYLTVVLALAMVLSLVVAGVCLVLMMKTRKRAATSQKRSGLTKDAYRMMVENADQGILVLQEFEFKYANQKAFDFMRRTKGKSQSAQLADYLHPPDLDIFLENYEKVIFGQDKVRCFNARVVNKDNDILWVNVRFVPMTWDGAPAILGFLNDITARKRMEKDLQQAQRMEAIGALSGGIAHDFNNILTTIIGNAEFSLMDLSDDDPQKEEFEQIRESGYRARDLVRQILTISRTDDRNIQAVYLTPMIKEALKLLRSTLPKEIQIKNSFDKSLKLVKADSIQIYQVFMNLCTNARDAVRTVESPCLEIALRNVRVDQDGQPVPDGLLPGNYVVISVKDNGAGIEPDAAKQIFEPHFTTKDSNSGTGLGLTTAMEIVKQYNGTITFGSEPEKGTCFKVYLPVYEPEQENPEPLGNDLAKFSGSLLFVDDEPEINHIAEKMLKSNGFTVLTADSGKKAMDMFSQSPDLFDIMITDLSMPGMSGDSLAAAVMQIRPQLPVIICTGYSDTFDEATAKKAGIAAYIQKPLDFKKLSSLAASLIKKARAG